MKQPVCCAMFCGFECTRARGHSGPHVALDLSGPVASWRDGYRLPKEDPCGFSLPSLLLEKIPERL